MEPDDRPAWDQERASKLIGARVLIGLTHKRPEGPELEQMFGRVRSAIAGKGIEVVLEGARAGETYWLPPHPAAFFPAAPGEYRLRSTGELVIDPDFLTTWDIEPPAG